MIVRDEATNLSACLAGARDLVDEVVVVDTGSIDRTPEIATSAGARVYYFPWLDNFATARNESLRLASGDWVFWLDADDRLDDRAQVALRALFAGLTPDPAVYLMQCALRHGPTDPGTVVEHARLFRNDPAVRWEYRVHEQILGPARRAGWPVRRAPVVIRHDGYVDPAARSAKMARNRRLLELDRIDRPGDPFVLFNLGALEFDAGRAAAAVPLLAAAVEHAPTGYPLLGKAYVYLSCAHRQLGWADAALLACRAGLDRMPGEPELLFYEGLLLLETGNPVGAEARFREVLVRPAPPALAGLDPGLVGYKARHNLAVALRAQRRWGEAEAEWRAVVREQPGFDPAWLGLAALLADRGRWADLEREADRAGADPRSRAVADVLRAKVLLGRQDFGMAIALLEAAVARSPHGLGLRILLAEVRWRQGDDRAATEQALRAVLAIDPNHLPTRRRLAELAARGGGSAGG